MIIGNYLVTNWISNKQVCVCARLLREFLAVNSVRFICEGVTPAVHTSTQSGIVKTLS